MLLERYFANALRSPVSRVPRSWKAPAIDSNLKPLRVPPRTACSHPSRSFDLGEESSLVPLTMIVHLIACWRSYYISDAAGKKAEAPFDMRFGMLPSLVISILYMKCRRILRLALTPVVEAGRGGVGVSEPFLDFRDVGCV
jgi:hypothetical protein